MSESNGESKPENGWVKLYSPRGPQVTLPVTLQPLDYAALLANVHAMLDAGWLVAAPGLEEGEQKEEVGWVLHGEHEREGETTPFVLLYANDDKLTWSILKVYLNKPADVAAFEYASRLVLTGMPLYVGQDKPQRGASKNTDKFIVRVFKPFSVVYKANPKHSDTEEGKMKPARLFVRWHDQAPPQKPEPEAPKVDSTIVDQWQKWLQKRPSLEAFNDGIKELSLDDPTNKFVWTLVCNHAEQRNWTFDKAAHRFVVASPEPMDVF